LANNQLPEYSLIVPNVLDDAHNGTLAQADRWLKIAPLLATPLFKQDGIRIIVFDEAETSDTQGGGGYVAALVIGPKVLSGHRSSVHYQHQNTLKTLMQALGLTSFPGLAASASGMGDFF
jgi:acid phosphatase